MITAENARELQQKSLLSRQQNAANSLAKLARLPALQDIALAVASNSTSLQGEPFQIDTLSRTRKHIEEAQTALDESLESRDWKAAKALSDALKALCEIERQLSGRSLPPTLRPKSGKDTKRQPSVTETPEQVAIPVTDTVNATLPSVNAPIQTGLSATPENGQ